MFGRTRPATPNRPAANISSPPARFRNQQPNAYSAPNNKGTNKLVYGNMEDVVRRVSKDLIISKAYRAGKPEGAFFSLCRP